MTLRETIVDWLTASRYVKWLEARHIEQRQDYAVIISDKDRQINSLRAELASLKLECDRMRVVLLPFGSPSGAAYAQRYQTGNKPPEVPDFTGPDDWQAELNKLYKEELDNVIPEQRRQEFHESASDDAA